MSQELIELLLTMDVPIHRIQTNDFCWFFRNLAINNRLNPNFNRAINMLEDEHRQKGRQPPSYINR